MISLDTILKLGNYKISGGSEYLWKSFGANARFLDFKDNDLSAVFDTETTEVYSVEITDRKRDVVYRLVNKAYRDDYYAEAESRGLERGKEYGDLDLTLVDLEEDHDFIEKAEAIRDGREYDTRVVISLNDLEDDVLFELMKLAHERDITLNQLIESLIEQAIKKHEAKTKKLDE